MKLIDTHAHLYLDELAGDREGVMERAKENGVGVVLMPAIDSATHESMFRLEEQYPQNCISMMGLHPCLVKENYRDELAIAAGFLEKRRFAAVGEIGLDFYWDLSFKEQQYEAFHQQVEWALHYDIPVVIHSRNATDECLQLLREHQKGKLKGVFHCFSGNADQARQVIEIGLSLGIGGVLTYKNSGLDQAIKNIDLRHIVLETDAPYLSPVPFRGKRNESSYLYYVAQKLADLKEMDIQQVAAITTQNAEKLFGL